MARFKYADAVADPEWDDDDDIDESPVGRVEFSAEQAARIEALSERYSRGLDFWTGKPLDAKDREASP